MRKIRIKAFDRQNLVVLETSALTKADLINELNAGGYNLPTENINFVDFATDNTIAFPSALLPNIDCLLCIVPLKTDQGGFDYTIEEVEDMSYNEVRTFASSLNKNYSAGIDMTGKRDAIVERVVDFLEDSYCDCDDTENEFITILLPKSVLAKYIDNTETINLNDIIITEKEITDKHSYYLNK